MGYENLLQSNQWRIQGRGRPPPHPLIFRPNWARDPFCRLRVVPHFSSGIAERAKCEWAWKSPHARKGDTRRGERKTRDYRQSPSVANLILLSPRRVPPFLAWGDFHTCLHFARSTIPEEKWGTTRSLSFLGWFAKTRYRKLFFPNIPNTPVTLAIFKEEAFIQVRVKFTEDLETNTKNI